MESKIIDEYVDAVLNNAPSHGFNISNLLSGLNLDTDLARDVKDTMLTLQYVERYGNLPVILTAFGKSVKGGGGHLKYLEQQSISEQKRLKKEDLDFEVLNSAIKQNKHLYKTRWYNY